MRMKFIVGAKSMVEYGIVRFSKATLKLPMYSPFLFGFLRAGYIVAPRERAESTSTYHRLRRAHLEASPTAGE